MKAVTASPLVGTCIHFEQARFNSNCLQLSNVAENTTRVIEAYMQLPHEKRPLDKKFLADMERDGFKTIENEYVAFGEAEITRAKVVIKAMQLQIREGIYTDLKPVKEAWNKMEAAREMQRQTIMDSYDLSLNFLDFQKSRVVLSDEGKAKLKFAYSVFIENEEQAEMWQSYLNLQTAFNAHVDRLRAIGYPMHPNLQPLVSNRSMMYENEKNYLDIHAEWFPVLKEMMVKTRKKAVA